MYIWAFICQFKNLWINQSSLWIEKDFVFNPFTCRKINQVFFYSSITLVVAMQANLFHQNLTCVYFRRFPILTNIFHGISSAEWNNRLFQCLNIFWQSVIIEDDVYGVLGADLLEWRCGLQYQSYIQIAALRSGLGIWKHIGLYRSYVYRKKSLIRNRLAFTFVSSFCNIVR